MQVTASNLTSGKNVSGVSSADTASISPSSNQLIVCTITSRTTASSTVETPTLSGNGLTWVQIATIQWDNTATSYKRTTMFRSMGASPSTGAITIDFNSQTQSDIAWWVDEFDNVETSGSNGDNAIIQSAADSFETPSEAQTTVVTLAAFTNNLNATYGVLCREDETDSGSDSVGSGFTSLAQVVNGSGNGDGFSIWKNSSDTTVDVTWGGSPVQSGGIAIEIRHLGRNVSAVRSVANTRSVANARATASARTAV